MIKYGTKSKLKSLKKLIRHLHIARANIAVVDLSGKDNHTFIQDVLACNADCITDFTGMISKCLGDKTYQKTDWFLDFDGRNLFNLIVEIDNVSSEETEPPRYEVVGVHILRWNDYTEEEELINAIWLNRSNNKYYCCEFTSRNDMQARYRVSDNANRELLLDSFKKLFLNFEERN